MSISIQVLPAKNGDCFLLHYGDKPIHMLIDCGYVDTFKKYVKQELVEIERAGGQLDHLILTHIDADHIWGAVALLKTNQESKFISIENVWHNTFRHLFELNKIQAETDASSRKLIKAIIQKGYKDAQKDPSGEVSAEQATTVGAYLLKGKYNWNAPFGQKAVCIEHGRRIKLDAYAELFLLSPDMSKLEALKTHWEDELLKYGFNYAKDSVTFYDDAFEMLMSWDQQQPKSRAGEKAAEAESLASLLSVPMGEDSTPTNGSAIAFVLEVKDKKLLFLADAHPDLVLESLNVYQTEGYIHFDLIKVAHHGSLANTSKELLDKIDSPRYLISTNGARDGHPDKETIAHIITRPALIHRELIFNYRTPTSAYFELPDWQESYHYSIHYLTDYPYTLILND